MMKKKKKTFIGWTRYNFEEEWIGFRKSFVIHKTKGHFEFLNNYTKSKKIRITIEEL